MKIQSRERAYFSKAPYFTEFIRQQVERKYGKEIIYQQGLRIYTSLNLSLQTAAQKAVEAGLSELDKRQGFRGPLRTLTVSELKDLQKTEDPLGPLSQTERYEGIILSKEDSKKHYTVWVEDRKGILPFSEMTWALHLKPTPTFKPKKAKTPSDLLEVGDVVNVRLKQITKKDQSSSLHFGPRATRSRSFALYRSENRIREGHGRGEEFQRQSVQSSHPSLADNPDLLSSPSSMRLPWKRTIPQPPF